MKRSPELAALSRDHHQALTAALRLRRAMSDPVHEAVAHFLDFWKRHGQRHSAIEKELLLPALPDDEGWAEAADRVRREHAEIRARTAELATAQPVEAARELGQLLRDHVRYEERHLFMLLEQRLAPEALARLGRELAAAERTS
jgi:hemerythrin-like domain-containing protein